MKDLLLCKTCGMLIDRSEAYLNNSLDFSCEDCFEEWDFTEGLLEDTYLYETQ
jgi:hypothetical protein